MIAFRSRTLGTRNSRVNGVCRFRQFSTELSSTSPSLQSVLSSYKGISESKDRFDRIVQSFDYKVKGSKYEVINYLNRNIGAISLAELIRHDIRTNLKKVKYPTPSSSLAATTTASSSSSSSISISSTIFSINLLDNILKEWLEIVMCDDALELQEVTFESSSGYMLQKIMQGEAVHAYKHISELKRRLCQGRHCYALLHRAMANDPIVFIHVALTEKIAHAMSDLTYTTMPTCAIFYSVNSPYTGYSGLDLAGRLIDRVTAKIKHDYPSVTTFCTLSPLPSYINWLKSIVFKEHLARQIMKAMPERLKADLYTLSRIYRITPTTHATNTTSQSSTPIAFVNGDGDADDDNNNNSNNIDDGTDKKDTSVENDSESDGNSSNSINNNNSSNISDIDNTHKSVANKDKSINNNKLTATTIDPGLHWLIKTIASQKLLRNESILAGIKDVTIWLGCYYITTQFKGTHKAPVDEVARFHLRRGASFHRLNWGANGTPLSMESSAGMMVNYLYDIPSVPEPFTGQQLSQLPSSKSESAEALTAEKEATTEEVSLISTQSSATKVVTESEAISSNQIVVSSSSKILLSNTKAVTNLTTPSKTKVATKTFTQHDIDNITFFQQYDLFRRAAIAKENVMNIPVGKQVIDILNDSHGSNSGSLR